MSDDNPILNDYVFKQVFGQKDNDPLLIAFLNAMLDGDIVVKSVKILNPELPRTSETSRNILLDVQAQVDDGTYVDIEVQQGYSKDLLYRMSVYGTRMVSKYSQKGTDFDSTRCIAIWLLNCNMPEFNIFGNDRIQGEVHFKSLDRTELSLPVELLKIYPVELKKGSRIEKFSEIKKTWIEFLRASNDARKTKKIEELETAYDKMQRITGSAKYRNYMEAVEKAEELERHKLFGAKATGIAEGEHKKAIETAKKMLSDGMSAETVSKYSGLSIEEVQKLVR